MMNHDYWGMGWIMWIIPILVVVLIIFLSRNNNVQSKKETPLEILKRGMSKERLPKNSF